MTSPEIDTKRDRIASHSRIAASVKKLQCLEQTSKTKLDTKLKSWRLIISICDHRDYEKFNCLGDNDHSHDPNASWTKDACKSSSNDAITANDYLRCVKRTGNTMEYNETEGAAESCNCICSATSGRGTNEKTILKSNNETELSRHECLNFPYILQMNFLADTASIEASQYLNPEMSRQQWRARIDLMSEYLDEKNRRVAWLKDYFASQPEFESLLADYTQAVLIVQPADVIAFTIQHFKAWAVRPE